MFSGKGRALCHQGRQVELFKNKVLKSGVFSVGFFAFLKDLRHFDFVFIINIYVEYTVGSVFCSIDLFVIAIQH